MRTCLVLLYLSGKWGQLTPSLSSEGPLSDYLLPLSHPIPSVQPPPPGQSKTQQKRYLRQLPKVRPHPAQFVQHTVVKLCLLFAAVTKQLQVGIIKASPILGERLRTVTLYLPGKEGWRLGIAFHKTEMAIGTDVKRTLSAHVPPSSKKMTTNPEAVEKESIPLLGCKPV